jgi:hypothetical protein
MKYAWACPYYGPTYPDVGFGQRANIANAGAAGHVMEDDYSTKGMQHREACETMLRRAAEDERIEAVVWTEHDVVLPPHAVERMAAVMEQTHADIVTGIVFRRCPPYSPMVTNLERVTAEQHERLKVHPSAKMRELANAWTLEEMNERNLITIPRVDPKAEPFPVDAASMGCLLISRRAARAIFDIPNLFAAEAHLSIDNVFFMHARRRGLLTVCAPDVLCGHLGDPEVVGLADWHKCVNEIIAKCELLKLERDPDIPHYGTLTRLANKYGSDKGSGCHQFTDIYEGFLGPIRHEVRRVLEIGVWQGASLRMWRDFFPQAVVHGIDIEEKVLNEDRISTFVMDQADRAQLAQVEGLYDLIVDDGGHFMDQQQVSLAALFPHVRPGGFYVLEDLHTSLMYPGWGIDAERGNTSLAMVEQFVSQGVMVSKHMSTDEMLYLTEQVGDCWVFRGKSPLSLTCVMRRRMAP